MKESLKNLLLLMSFFLCLFSGVFYFTQEKPTVRHQASVFLRNTYEDGGHNRLKQGMEQAAKDFQMDLSFVSLGEEQPTQEWIQLVKNELAKDQSGVILELSSTLSFEQFASDLYPQTTLLINEAPSKNNSGFIPSVSPDYEQLGTELGQLIIEQNQLRKPVLLVEPSQPFSESSRELTGIVRQLEKHKLDYETISENDWQMKEKNLGNLDYFGIVCFTSEMNERIGKLKKQRKEWKKYALYGFGFSNQLISDVDQEILQGLGVTNQYALGYIAVRQLFFQIEKKEVYPSQVSQMIVTKENLFDEENQKLFFPFIQ